MKKWPLVLTMASACVPMAVDARQAASTASSLQLEAMSHADAEQVGAVGTGCTWRGGPGRKARLSMADDRAAIRRNGEIVALKPAAYAKALFFTYDRWTGGGISILIRDRGKVVARGNEHSETIATLELTERGRTLSYPGRLSCGS